MILQMENPREARHTFLERISDMSVFIPTRYETSPGARAQCPPAKGGTSAPWKTRTLQDFHPRPNWISSSESRKPHRFSESRRAGSTSGGRRSHGLCSSPEGRYGSPLGGSGNGLSDPHNPPTVSVGGDTVSYQGLGRIYRRRDSRFWWIAISVRGKRHSESSKSVHIGDARALLAKRIEQFRLVPGLLSRVTVSELLDDYLRDLEIRGARALDSFERHARILREYVGSRVAALLEPGEVYELQQALRKRFASSSVNFTVGFLRTSFRHAARNGRIERRLEFPRALPVNNARKGFLERADYTAILEELPEWARDPFRLLYTTGWRRGEVMSLSWAEVDFDAGMLHLDPARSKNRKGRPFPFMGEMADVLARRQAARVLGVPFVFHRFGRCISGSCFLKHFREAATIAGRPNLIPHDCRRSAARRLLRAGIREDVVMAMIGWSTRAMLTRYAIVSESDLEDAAAKVDEYMERQSAEAKSRVLPFGKEKP